MAKKIKKILAVTGIRSEYDILFPVIDSLRKHKSFSGSTGSLWGTLIRLARRYFKRY